MNSAEFTETVWNALPADVRKRIEKLADQRKKASATS